MNNTDSGLTYLNEGRIILLGEGGVGKSSIVNRIIDNRFNAYSESTQGIGIKDWYLNANLNNEVLMHFWDFGGQEIFYSTYSIFLSKRTVYIIVFDGRNKEGESNLNYWLNLIQIFGENSPTLIVINKVDERNVELNRRSILEEFPFVVGFNSVSAKTGVGIEELKQSLISTLNNLSHLKNQIPTSWSKIRQQIKDIKDNFISLHSFSEICRINNLEDKKSQDLLLEFFHDLGIIFYIKESKSASSIVFLNTGWLVASINRIIDSVSIKEEDGQFYAKELLEDSYFSKYPKNVIETLLQIMEDRELCFKINDKNGCYLIPILLPIEEPNEIEKFKLSRHLSFVYSYSFLPRNIISRFIVRAQLYGSNSLKWRSGSILSLEDNLALVSVNTIKLKIKISIIGPEKGKTNLLKIIRENFDQIHESYPSLSVEELIPVPAEPDTFFNYKRLLSMKERGINQLQSPQTGSFFNIQELLERVEVSAQPKKPLNIFISYSHDDIALKKELELHLSSLKRNGYINVWSDNEIFPGQNWDESINNELKKADIVLALVGPNLLASEYFIREELKVITELSRSGNLQLVPIIVRSSNWRDSPLIEFQAIPSSGQPISSFKNRDAGWVSVAGEIKKIIERIRGEKIATTNFIISKIIIENIRSIENLEIDLEFNDKETPAMFALILGENGVGKSTILKCIALGLAGEAEATGLLSQMPGQFLRFGSEAGRIVIDLIYPDTKEKFTIETKFQLTQSGEVKASKKVPNEFSEEKLFICGYGASRSGFGTEDIEKYMIGKATQTLFDYQARLQNPELSFRRIQSEGVSLNEIAKRLDELLMIEPGSTVIGSSGIKITGFWGDFVPIGGLSDGYRATVGWISDLIGWSFQFSSDMLRSEISGIVLVDELEQHLHPRWQRIIVQLLREQFPKIQFITTSHTPLLASGASDFEDTIILSLERDIDSNRIQSRRILNSSLGGKTVNKILLEEFGLLSSLSPKSISKIERYSELISKNNLTKKESEELVSISEKLDLEFDPTIDSELKKKIKKHL